MRPVLEKRLAQLGVVARITDDEHSITVRIPDLATNGDTSAVVQLLTLPAKLEFCPEATPVAGTFCDIDAGVEVVAEEGDRRDCALQSPDAKRLLSLTQDAGVSGQVLVGGMVPDGPIRTFVAETECLAPRLMEAEVKPDPNTGRKQLAVLDAPSAAKFGDLTGKLVRRRLLIVLDGRVQSAPVVMEPITGGGAIISSASSRRMTRSSGCRWRWRAVRCRGRSRSRRRGGMGRRRSSSDRPGSRWHRRLAVLRGDSNMRTMVLMTCVLLTGCFGTVGGPARMRPRRVTLERSEKNLSLQSGVRATVTTGARGVSITTDDNLVELVETVVENDTLIVRMKPGVTISTSRGLRATISNDVIEGVSASGGLES